MQKKVPDVKAQIPVPAEGDGNCAFNSFVLGLRRLVLEFGLKEPANAKKFIDIFNKIMEENHITNEKKETVKITSWTDFKKYLSNIDNTDVGLKKLQKELAPVMREFSSQQVAPPGGSAPEGFTGKNHKPGSLIALTAAFRNYKINPMNIGIDIFDFNRPIQKKYLSFLQPEFEKFKKLSPDAVAEQALAQWWEQKDGGYEKFIKVMRTDTVWAGDLELAPLAEYFGINLSVATPGASQQFRMYSNYGQLNTAELKLSEAITRELKDRGVIDRDPINPAQPRVFGFYRQFSKEELGKILSSVDHSFVDAITQFAAIPREKKFQDQPIPFEWTNIKKQLLDLKIIKEEKDGTLFFIPDEKTLTDILPALSLSPSIQQQIEAARAHLTDPLQGRILPELLTSSPSTISLLSSRNIIHLDRNGKWVFSLSESVTLHRMEGVADPAKQQSILSAWEATQVSLPTMSLQNRGGNHWSFIHAGPALKIMQTPPAALPKSEVKVDKKPAQPAQIALSTDSPLPAQPEIKTQPTQPAVDQVRKPATEIRPVLPLQEDKTAQKKAEALAVLGNCELAVKELEQKVVSAPSEAKGIAISVEQLLDNARQAIGEWLGIKTSGFTAEEDTAQERFEDFEKRYAICTDQLAKEALAIDLLKDFRAQVNVINQYKINLASSFPQALSAAEIEAKNKAAQKIDLLYKQFKNETRVQTDPMYQEFKNADHEINKLEQAVHASKELDEEVNKLKEFLLVLQNPNKQKIEPPPDAKELTQRFTEMKSKINIAKDYFATRAQLIGAQAKAIPKAQQVEQELLAIEQRFYDHLKAIENCHQAVLRLSAHTEDYEQYFKEIESKTPADPLEIHQKISKYRDAQMQETFSITDFINDPNLPSQYKAYYLMRVNEEESLFQKVHDKVTDINSAMKKQKDERENFDTFLQSIQKKHASLYDYFQHCEPNIINILAKAWANERCNQPNNAQLQELNQALDQKAFAVNLEMNWFINECSKVNQIFAHIFFAGKDRATAAIFNKAMKSTHAREITDQAIKEGKKLFQEASAKPAKRETIKIQFNEMMAKVIPILKNDYIGDTTPLLLQIKALENQFASFAKEFKDNPDIELIQKILDRFDGLDRLIPELKNCKLDAERKDVSSETIASEHAELRKIAEKQRIQVINIERFLQDVSDKDIRMQLDQQLEKKKSTFNNVLKSTQAAIDSILKKYPDPATVVTSAQAELKIAQQTAEQIKQKLQNIYIACVDNVFEKVVEDLGKANKEALTIDRSIATVAQMITQLRPGDAKAIGTVNQIGHEVTKIKTDLSAFLFELNKLSSLPAEQKLAIEHFNNEIDAFNLIANTFGAKFKELSKHPEAILDRLSEVKPIIEQLNQSYLRISDFGVAILAIPIAELQKALTNKLDGLQKIKQQVDQNIQVLGNPDLLHFAQLLKNLHLSVDDYATYIKDNILSKDVITETEQKSNQAPIIFKQCESKFTELDTALMALPHILPPEIRQAAEKRYHEIVDQQVAQFNEASKKHADAYNKAKTDQLITAIGLFNPSLDRLNSILYSKQADIADYYRGKSPPLDAQALALFQKFQKQIAESDRGYLEALINNTFFGGNAIITLTPQQANELYAESVLADKLEAIKKIIPAPPGGYVNLLAYFQTKENKDDFCQKTPPPAADERLEAIFSQSIQADEKDLQAAFDDAGFNEIIIGKGVIGELRFLQFMQEFEDELKQPEFAAFKSLLTTSNNFQKALIEHWEIHPIDLDILIKCNKTLAEQCPGESKSDKVSEVLSETIFGDKLKFKLQGPDIAKPEELANALRIRALYSARFVNNSELKDFPYLKNLLNQEPVKTTIIHAWDQKAPDAKNNFKTLIQDLTNIRNKENWENLDQLNTTMTNALGVNGNVFNTPIQRGLFAEIQFKRLHDHIEKEVIRGKTNLKILFDYLENPTFSDAVKKHIDQKLFPDPKQIFAFIKQLQTTNKNKLRDLISDLITNDVTIITEALYAANKDEQVRCRDIKLYVENPVLRSNFIEYGVDLGQHSKAEFKKAFNHTNPDEPPPGFNVWMRREAKPTADEIKRAFTLVTLPDRVLDEKSINTAEGHIKRLYQYFAETPLNIDDKNPEVEKPKSNDAKLADKMANWRLHHAGYNTRFHNEKLRNLLISKACLMEDAKPTQQALIEQLRLFDYGTKDYNDFLQVFRNHQLAQYQGIDINEVLTEKNFRLIKFYSAIDYEPEHLQELATTDLTAASARIDSLSEALEQLPDSPEIFRIQKQLLAKKPSAEKWLAEVKKFTQACDSYHIPVDEKGIHPVTPPQKINLDKTADALVDKFDNASSELLRTVMLYDDLVDQQKLLEEQIKKINLCERRIKNIGTGVVEDKSTERYQLGSDYNSFCDSLRNNTARPETKATGELKPLDGDHVDLLKLQLQNGPSKGNDLWITTRKEKGNLIADPIKSPFSLETMANHFVQKIKSSNYDKKFNKKYSPFDLTKTNDSGERDQILYNFIIECFELIKKGHFGCLDAKCFEKILTIKQTEHDLDFFEIGILSTMLAHTYKKLTPQQEVRIKGKYLPNLLRTTIPNDSVIETGVLTLHEMLKKRGNMPENTTIYLATDPNPDIMKVQILYLENINRQLPREKQFKIDYDKRFDYGINDEIRTAFTQHLATLNLPKAPGFSTKSALIKSIEARQQLSEDKTDLAHLDKLGPQRRRNTSQF